MPPLAYAVLTGLVLAAASAHAAPTTTTTTTTATEPATATAPAAAVPRVYVGAGVELGLDIGPRAGLAVDVGVRPWRAPLYLRAGLGWGRHVDDPFVGGYLAAALGAEWQGCRRDQAICGFAGVDAGVFRRTFPVDAESLDDDNLGGHPYQRPPDVMPALMPRLGFAFGAPELQLRLTAQGFVHAEGGFPFGLSLGAALVARI